MSRTPARLFRALFRRPPRRPTWRPAVEALEDRTVPSTWVGGGYAASPAGDFSPAGSAWSNPANWLGGVPRPGDSAVFTQNVMYMTASGPRTGPATDPVLDASFTVGGLQTDSSYGGTISPSASGNTLTLANTSQIAGGNVGVQLVNNGTLVLTGGTFSGGRTLTNHGTVTQPVTIAIDPGETITNAAGALWDLQNDAGISSSERGVLNEITISNAGTFRKSSGTGTSAIQGGAQVALNNLAGGTLDVRSGTFAVQTDLSTGGTLLIAPGAVLNLQSDAAAPAGAFGTYTGTYTASGGGNVEVNGSLRVGDQTGATFTFNAGSFQWTGGTILGNGGLTVNGPLDITGSVSLGGPLTNGGTITQTGHLNFSNGTLINPAGHLYDLQADDTFTGNFPASGAIDNAGTFRKSAGSGAAMLGATFPVPFNLDGGTIDAESGTLELLAGSGTGGSLIAGAGALLQLGGTGGTFSLSGTYTGSGTGQVELTDGILDVGTSGATFDFPAGLFRWTGGTVQGQGGLTNTGSLTLAGGDALRGVLTNTGTIAQTAGGLSLDGTLNNVAGALFDLQADAGFSVPLNRSGNVNNAGLFRKSAGTGTSTIEANGGFNNTGTVEAASGTLDLARPSWTSAGGVVQVSGSVLTGGTWKASGGATLTISTAGGLGTNQATVILSGPGSTFTNINALANNAGTFSLLGGRNFTTAGDLANTGTLTLGPASTLTVSGNYTQGSSGTLDVQLGGPPASGQFGQLVLTDPSGKTAALDGTLRAELVNGYAPGGGDTFQVMGYGAHTGTFAAYNLPSSGAVHFTAAVAGNGVFLNAQAPSLQFSAPGITASETGGPVTLMVTRTGGSAGAVSVQVRAVAGTARAGTDYAVSPAVLSWTDGDSSPKTVTITPLDDGSIGEGDETATLMLTAPTGGAELGAPATAALTITEDNDTAPPPSPAPPPSSGGPTVVLITPGTMSEGQTGLTLTVNGGGFTPSSVVLADGRRLATVFVSPNRLEVRHFLEQVRRVLSRRGRRGQPFQDGTLIVSVLTPGAGTTAGVAVTVLELVAPGDAGTVRERFFARHYEEVTGLDADSSAPFQVFLRRLRGQG